MIEKLQAEEVEIKSLKLEENSRMRVGSDLSELMENIKQIGIIQPIIVRRKDRVVICGNRRLEASKKLGNKTIPVVWRDDVSDEDLLVMNLAENLQRRSITTIEIGRIVDILAEKGLSVVEIATRLGINPQRIKLCLFAYKKTPDEFKSKIKLIGHLKEKTANIPEGVFWGIIRLNKRKKLTDDEFNFLLKKALDDEWTSEDVKVVSYLLSGRSVKEAVAMKDDYFPKQVVLIFNKKEITKEMQKAGFVSYNDFVRRALLDINKNLLI